MWTTEAGISRFLLRRYRLGLNAPSVEMLANLVRSASRILGRPVRAGDLYDLGENVPLNGRKPAPYRKSPYGARKTYPTRLDQCLLREGVSPVDLARTSGISRQGILRKRTGAEVAFVGVAAKLVRAMRRMGRDVRARDLFDVGDDDA